MNNNKNEIKLFIFEVLKSIKEDIDFDNLKEDINLKKDKNFDDLDFTDIAIQCEEKYDIVLNELIIEELKNISEIIDYIYKEIEEQNKDLNS